MPSTARKITVQGVPDKPFITDIWVQTSPDIQSEVLFAVTVGVSDMTLLDVAADQSGNHLKGKVYNWFKLGFADGRVGWMREDFLLIQGDFSEFGYGVVAAPTNPFTLKRQTAAAGAAPVPPPSQVENRPFLAAIVGIPSLETVNIRSGPSTTYTPPIASLKKGVRGLKVLDAKPDEKGNASAGRVYQWLKLALPDGKQGWCRDDLIEVEGDGRKLGYDLVQEPILAALLTRTEGAAPRTGVTLPTGLPDLCKGLVISQVPARVRKGQNVTHPIVTQIPPGTEVQVFNIKPQDDGGPYQWAEVQFAGQRGWSRSDNFTFKGDCETLGLVVPSGDLYPLPMKEFRWVRGFTGTDGHRGWDLAFTIGTPVFCGPQGGWVERAHRCTKCTPEKPSTIDHGIPLGDEGVYSDPGWGWGFGNHVIIRYTHSQLPPSTQTYLTNNAMHGWHLYVVYAHLNSLGVAQSNTLSKATQLGTLGNTGNSTGPHLHIEVRAWPELKMGPWLKARLLEPNVLFQQQ